MIEKRAKAYLAWLAEYKGRQLLEYVGTNAPFLLGTFAEFSGYDYEEDVEPKMIKGAAKNYAEKAKTFLYLLQDNTWQRHDLFTRTVFRQDGIDTEKSEADFPDIFDEHWQEKRDKLLLLQDDIAILLSFALSNKDSLPFLLETQGRTNTAAAIIQAITGDSLHALYDFDYYHGYIPAFAGNSIEIRDTDGNTLTVGISALNVKGGKLRLQNVEIDLSVNMEDILADTAVLICSSRQEAASDAILPDIESGAVDEEAWEAQWDNGCLGFGPCSGGNCERTMDQSIFSKVLRKAQARGSYSPRSDPARAVGLWLWDYIRDTRCSVGAAVRELKKQDFLTPLQFSSSPDRVFERIYARTRECIEQGEVLSMR